MQRDETVVGVAMTLILATKEHEIRLGKATSHRQTNRSYRNWSGFSKLAVSGEQRSATTSLFAQEPGLGLHS
jgi:hypothetical protein